MAVRHDAFISYSHSADTRVAEALESGLEKLAKPPFKLHALDVFRDQTSLVASPALWPEILKHLSVSDWFLFFASPASAASKWCNEEVKWWLENRPSARLLIVLTEGEIAWDGQACDFDWSRTTAVSRLLSKRCEDEPLYVDLRWARGSEFLTLRNAQFREAVVNIAAPIRGMPKDELDGADLRQLVRNRRMVQGGIALISAVAALAIWQAFVASQQREEAERQRDIAFARQLGAQAEVMRVQQPERLPLALLMAAESARRQPEAMEVQQTLRAVLSQFPLPAGVLSHSSAVNDVAFNGDQSLVATAGADGALWKLPEGVRIASLEGARDLVFFSPDGGRVFGCCQRVGVWTRDGVEELSLGPSDFRAAPRNLSLSKDGRLLAVGLEGAKPGFAVYDFEAREIVARHQIEASGDGTAIAFGMHGELFFAPRSEIQVYSAATWQLAATLHPGFSGVQRLSVSPSGRHLAVSNGEDISFFDLERGKLEKTDRISGDAAPGNIEQLGFDATGRYVAAIGRLNRGAVWEAGAWRKVLPLLHGEFQDVHSFAFDPTATEVVSCGADGHCFGWSLASGQRVHQVAHVYAHTDEDSKRQMTSSAFGSRDPLLLTGGVDGTARLWRTSSPTEEQRAQCLADEVIVRTFTGQARSWSADRHQIEQVKRECSVAHPDEARYGTMGIAPGSTFAAATIPVDQVRVWNSRTGEQIAVLDHGDAVDWDEVKARLEGRGMSYRFAVSEIMIMKSAGSARVLAVSSSGKRIATWRAADDRLRVWDTQGNRILSSERTGTPPVVMEFLSDSTLLRVEASGALSVRNIDGSVMWSADHAALGGVTVSRDGSKVAASHGESAPDVRVWDVSSGEVVFQAKIEAGIGDLVFDRTGRYLLALGRYGYVDTGLPLGVEVTVWDALARRELLSLPKTDGIVAIDFSADQKQIAMMSRSGELRLWDLTTNEIRRAITPDPGPVAFSENGRWLAMGGRSIRIIDAKSLRSIAQLDIGGQIRALEFGARDSTIAARRFDSGATQGVVEVHRWQPQDLLAEACRRMPLEAAEKQWRQLQPDQPIPTPCSRDSAPAKRI